MIHRFRRRTRGQSLVEFALMLPVLLMLTLGVLDAARIYSGWISLTNAVREGALFASTENNSTHWCGVSGAIACPAGAVAGTTAQCDEAAPAAPIGIQCPDPDNIAFLMELETEGLDQSRITLLAPTCTGGTCDTTAAATVTIRASYQMNMILPVISGLFGDPLTMSASATAPILR